MKQKIAARHGVSHLRLKLFPRGQLSTSEQQAVEVRHQTVEMDDHDTLLNYSLADGVSMALTNEIVSKEVVRLRFDSLENSTFEEISGQSGRLSHPHSIEAVDRDGRNGIRFSSRCTFWLPFMIDLGAEFTISVWTHAP